MSYNAILQESTLFELFESSSYSDTLKALVLAQQEITAKILSIPGDTWTRKRLQSVRKLIDEEILKAYSGTLPALQSELPVIAEIVAANILVDSFTKVSTSVIDYITSNKLEVQGYSADELFKSIADNHARQLRALVGSGVAQGKTANTIVNELIQKHSQLSKAQLRTAIFTTIAEARAYTSYNAFDGMQKSGVIKGYEYVATLDGRTTEYCRDHDGRRYYKPIGEIQNKINVHFNCRSRFIPFTESTKKDTRASQFGQVPDEPYSKWFSKQDENFQRKVLGSKKFNAYKKGSYKIGGLPDIKGQKLDLDEISSLLKALRKKD